MDIKFVENRKKHHGKYVHSVLDKKDNIIIMVAFLKWSGLKEFIDKINYLAEAEKSITIFIGLDFYISDPKAIIELYKIIAKKKSSKLYLVQGFRDTFHPKIYCGVREGQATFLVGSANMTSGGMKSNFEVSSYFVVSTKSEYYVDFNEYLSNLVLNKNTKEANLLIIDQYKTNHKIFNSKKTKAESDAKKEINDRFQLDIDGISGFLEEYRDDEEEISDFLKKKKNYRKARKLLKLLSSGNVKTKPEFIVIYDQLVGSKGQSSLWHSGGLLRQKTRISKEYKHFIKMLVEMDQNMGVDPEILFEIGMRHAKNIKGLGVNVVTEIMNTYSPKKYSVLNKNPLSSLSHLGFSTFKGQASFKPEDYHEYNALIKEFARICEFDDLSQVDHFMNFVYWGYVK